MRWILLSTVLLLPLRAGADEVPGFDVRPACAARAGAATELDACLKREGELWETLTKSWGWYPDYRKHYCTQMVAFQRRDHQSYSLLARCLDNPDMS